MSLPTLEELCAPASSPGTPGVLASFWLDVDISMNSKYPLWRRWGGNRKKQNEEN
jgi:hypothetical protein